MNAPSTEGFDAIIMCDADPLMAIAQAAAAGHNPAFSLPVIIPDVVFRDATGGQVAVGRPDIAMAVLGWVNGHDDIVRIVVTEAGLLQDKACRAGDDTSPWSEIAVREVTDRLLDASPNQKAILVYGNPALPSPLHGIRCETVQLDALIRLFEG